MTILSDSVGPERYRALDALRGVAALAIAVFHYRDNWAGYLMVDFFFVLSGFVLAHTYLRQPSRVSFKEFIVRRVARLYPLHLYTLVVFAGVLFFLNGSLPSYADGTGTTFAEQVLLIQNVGLNPNGPTWNVAAWSVSVEFWVSLLVILVLLARPLASSTLVAVAVFCFLLILDNPGHLDTYSLNYFGWLNSGLARGMGTFLLGIVVYRIYLKTNVRGIRSGYATALELLVMAAVLAVIILRADKRSPMDFAAPIVFASVIFVFAWERGWLSTRLRRLEYLGTISYSVYLNHLAVLLLVLSASAAFALPSGLSMAIYIAGVLLYSVLTYRYVERPGRTAFRRLGTSSQRVPWPPA